MRELANGEARTTVQGTGLLELTEHSIHSVRRLMQILEDHQRTTPNHRVRCAAERSQEREVSAREPAPRATRRHHAGIGPVSTRFAGPCDGRLQRLRAHRRQLRARRVRVKRDHAGTRRDRTVQRCDIRKADHRFRRARERIQRELRRNARESKSATHTPHRVDRRIIKR